MRVTNVQVGPAVERLVLPGQEDTDPENDKEIHVSAYHTHTTHISCIALQWHPAMPGAGTQYNCAIQQIRSLAYSIDKDAGLVSSNTKGALRLFELQRQQPCEV